MTLNIPKEKQSDTPRKKDSAEKIIDEDNKTTTAIEKIVSWLKENCTSENENFNRFQTVFLVLSLSSLLTINQFLVQTRFFFYNTDVFFQLVMPGIFSLFIIYWVEDLNDFILITVGGFILFILFYIILINLPWLLGFISNGTVITVFFNIVLVIRLLPLIFVMMLFGGGVATIIRAITNF
ncbi:MAG: hypothetical protein ACXAEU_08000 [Candidatus Hodarchaeales archaeon]|jgi:hypothetical protein